jgi:hypothetical protein
MPKNRAIQFADGTRQPGVSRGNIHLAILSRWARPSGLLRLYVGIVMAQLR